MSLDACWACGIPASTENHHVTPRQYGGTDDPANILPLCSACHDLLDRHAWFQPEVVAWLHSELAREPGPRWARILMLQLAKMAAWYRTKNDSVNFSHTTPA